MKRCLVPSSDDCDDMNPILTNPSKRRKMNASNSEEDVNDFVSKQKSRKRKKKKKHAKHSKQTASNCSICLEYMNSSGNHQICCLKCGHLFGRKCIQRTIRKNGLCPICKTENSIHNIRNLFNTNISVRDIGDRDEWMNKCDSIMLKLHKEMAETQSLKRKVNKLENINNSLQSTNKTLKLELIRMKSKYQNEQNERIELMTSTQVRPDTLSLSQFKFNPNPNHNATHNHNNNNKSVINRIGYPLETHFFKKIAFGNKNINVSKVFEFDNNFNHIFYSYYGGMSGYNINKYDMETDKSDNIIVNHLKKINDIRYNYQSREILCVSDDKTISVSDINIKAMNKNKKYYFALPDIGCKCLWSNICEYYVYAACQNGYFCIFDIRRNHKHIVCKKLIDNNSNSYFNTLCSLKDNKLLISSNNECFMLNEYDLINNNQCLTSILNSSSCDNIYSCDYNKKCDSVLVSDKYNHNIVNLNNLNDKITVNNNEDNIHSFSSSLFCMNNENKYICFASSNKLNIYSCDYNDNNEYRFKTTFHTFKKHATCFDIKIFDSDKSNKIIGALCDTNIVFYTCCQKLN